MLKGATVREEQILELILKGRNYPWICRSLGIARNTLKTHVKNLYLKAGVHSRQKLISFVEEKRGLR